MSSLLVIEDVPKDARVACQVAQSAGFTAVECKGNASEAKKFLADALAAGTVPDAILLDIDLNGESGFDVMRFWHSNPKLKKIALIVWTVLEGNYPEICRLFGVNYVVSKAQGAPPLEAVLASVVSTVNSQAAQL